MEYNAQVWGGSDPSAGKTNATLTKFKNAATLAWKSLTQKVYIIHQYFLSCGLLSYFARGDHMLGFACFHEYEATWS